MSDEQYPLPGIVTDLIARREAGETGRGTLENILPGDGWEFARHQLMETGTTIIRDKDAGEVVMTASFDNNGMLMDVAAAIPRKSGSAIDFLNTIDDFNDMQNVSSGDRKSRVALFHRIYKADGLTNNAISKLAALIAPKCNFKVKAVRGQRGRTNDQTRIELETLLNWWKDRVNSNAVDAVITGSRGVQTWVRRGSRLALIEGDHIARTYWQSTKVGNLGNFDLPMNIQTFSSQFIEPVEGLEFTDVELFYWKPPQKFITQLTNATDKNLDKVLKRYIPSKVKAELIKTQKYLLDPALLIHVKNQGTDIDMFGESLIAPSMTSIRYKRALDALEMTVITNIMARVVIIKVGSDNPESSYHKAEVTRSRLGTLQRAFAAAGPQSALLWGGPDIDVVEVSAHNAMLDLVPRYQLAERRQMMDLGIPAVLMIGEGSDGKAVANSSAMSAVTRAAELQDQYKQALEQIAEQIAMENGFQDVEVICEWAENILADKEAAANLLIKTFQLGLTSTRTTLEGIGLDPDAEGARQQEDVDNGFKDEPFGAPKGAMTNNVTGTDPSGSGGRPAKSGTPDPRKNKETKAKTPNK